MKAAMLVGLVVMVTPLVAVAGEQSAATHGASPVSQEGLRMRYEVRVMERVLEQAVQHGAQVVGQQLQSLIPMMLFTTPARARGFRLDGYGVFFDVEIPPIRRSMAWSFQTLDQLDLGVNSALQALRQHVQSLGIRRAVTWSRRSSVWRCRSVRRQWARHSEREPPVSTIDGELRVVRRTARRPLLLRRILLKSMPTRSSVPSSTRC